MRGQATRLRADSNSEQLSVVVDHAGYLIPAVNGVHHCGASYVRDDCDNRPRQSEDMDNLEKLEQHLPALKIADRNILGNHAAIRYTTPDRLPYIGPVPDESGYRKTFSDLSHGRHWQLYDPAPVIPGLYVASTFASRGFTSTALCAEILASMVNNEPLPVSRSIMNAVHPARYLIRELKRQP